MRSLSLLLGVVFLGVASQAQAEGYIGFQLNSLKYDSPNFDKVNSYGIYGGRRITDVIAVELSYLDFGESEDGILPIWTISGDSLAAGVKMSAPISDRAAFIGRLGMHRWDVEISEEGSGTIGDNSGTDPYYGIGIEVDLTENMTFGLQYTIYDLDGEDLSAKSANLNFLF